MLYLRKLGIGKYSRYKIEIIQLLILTDQRLMPFKNKSFLFKLIL